MPVEIRELVIKATVTQEQETPSPAAGANAAAEAGKEDTVAECVEQVLQILKSKTER